MNWRRLNFTGGVITLILTTMLVFEWSAEAQSFKLKNYFPLSEGITWGYLETYSDGAKKYAFVTIGGNEIVNGVVTKKEWFFAGDELNDGDNVDYSYNLRVWTKEGFKRYKEVGSDGSFTVFNPPAIDLPSVMRIGETFSHTSIVTVHDPDGNVTNSYTYIIELTLMGVEDITVKAGSFTRCLKFSEREFEEGEWEDETFWLAPGIGEVKSSEVSSELISFTKGNKSYYPKN